MSRAINFFICFIVFLFLSRCNDRMVEVQPKMVKGYISVTEDPFMLSYKAGLLNTNSRTVNKINWEDIYRVYNPETEVKTYTLFKKSKEPGAYDNLVIMKMGDLSSSYIIRYIPEKDWLSSMDLSDFTGRVEFLTSDEKIISGLNYENGVSEISKPAVSGRIQGCETVYEIHWTESCAEGGDCVGGDTIVIYEWEVCNNPTTGAYETLDAAPRRDRNSGGGISTGGGDPSVNLNDPSHCLSGGVKDENGNCIEYILEDPCLIKVADKALKTNLDDTFKNIIEDAFNSSDDVNLIIRDDFKFSDHRTLGKTEISESWGVINVDIYLNSERLSNSSQEFIASTIFHEAFHSIFRYLDVNKEYESTPTDHHVSLFNNYVDILKASMMTTFPLLSERHAKGLILKGVLAYSTWGDMYDGILKKNGFSETELKNISDDYELKKKGTPCK